jgi:hypothetical protein
MTLDKVQCLVLLFIVTLFPAACTHTVKKDPQETVESDTVATETSELNPINRNTIDEESIKPYEEVDRLIKKTEQEYTLTDVLKLESICIKSDGDLSEKYYQVSKGLFNNHLGKFVKYISEHPNSCLKAKLIEAIGADMSVYEKNERLEHIKQEKEKTLAKANREKLSVKQIRVIESIYKSVNPALFD